MREVEPAPPTQEEPAKAQKVDLESTRATSHSNADTVTSLLGSLSFGGPADPPPPPHPAPALPTTRSPVRRAARGDAELTADPLSDLPRNEALVLQLQSFGPMPPPRSTQPPLAALRNVHGWCNALAETPSAAAALAAQPKGSVVAANGDSALTMLRRLALANAAVRCLSPAARSQVYRCAVLGLNVTGPLTSISALWPASWSGPNVDGAADRHRLLKQRMWTDWRQRLAELDGSDLSFHDQPEGVAAEIGNNLLVWPGDDDAATSLVAALSSPTEQTIEAAVALATSVGDAIGFAAVSSLRAGPIGDLLQPTWALGGHTAVRLLIAME